MGYDPQSNQFRQLSEDEASSYVEGPVFRVGEEVTLKGLIFTIVDIAPGQMKLKPKKLAMTRGQELEERNKAMEEMLRKRTEELKAG